MKKINLSILVVILLLCSIYPQDTTKKNYLLSSAEILKIMTDSKVMYNIIDTTIENKEENPEVVGDQFYTVKVEDGKASLYRYNLSDEGTKEFHDGEKEFASKNYDAAIEDYKQILTTDPTYYKAYVYIGDGYFFKEDYDSAKYYFQLAVDKNFIDYDAHWFLADTYSKLDNPVSAFNEIITAHLLNRNHKRIMGAVKYYFEKMGRKWQDWDIKPEGQSYEKEGKVYVAVTKEWTGYDLAEAVWKYEPDFAEGILGKKYIDGMVTYEKEAGCIAANLNLPNMEKELKISNEGFFQEMIWYEIISKKAPKALLLIPDNFFLKLVEYIKRYH